MTASLITTRNLSRQPRSSGTAGALSTWQIPAQCCICAGSAFATNFFVGGTPVARCLCCGLTVGVHPPSVEANSAIYDADYFDKAQTLTTEEESVNGYRDYSEVVAVNQATYRARLGRLAERMGGVGRMLDIGCAFGGSLIAARSLGWEAYGLEISEYAARVARESYGLPVQAGIVATAQFPDHSFDAVTMWHTIEHLPDPVADLARVRRWLRPGGVIQIVTPDVGSRSARLLGPRWYHYKPGEHLYYFDRRTVQGALTRAGFGRISAADTKSRMTTTYVFDRLSKYNRPLSRLTNQVSGRLGMNDAAFWLHIGELEAFGESAAPVRWSVSTGARPRELDLTAPPERALA